MEKSPQEAAAVAGVAWPGVTRWQKGAQMFTLPGVETGPSRLLGFCRRCRSNRSPGHGDGTEPLSIKSFTAKSRPPAWKHLPSWYMVATEDQMIPQQAEEFMAKRMGAEVRKVASSHAVMVSHSKKVAGLITAAADAVADSTK